MTEDKYYIGSAIDNDLEFARKKALDNLSQGIQVFIRSFFETHKAEVMAKNKNVQYDSTSLLIVAHSSMELRDVGERVEKQLEGGYKVIKYVSRASVAAMIELRKTRIRGLIAEAEKELFSVTGTGVDVAQALRCYYWAYLLASVTPDTMLASFRKENETVSSPFVLQELANAIESAARKIVFVPEKKIPDDYIVWKYRVQFGSSSVISLKFNFFDGMGDNPAEVKNGNTQLTFFFSNQSTGAKESRALLDFSEEPHMDDLLRAAHTMRGSKCLEVVVAIPVPLDGKPPVQPTPPISRKKIPKTIEQIRSVLADATKLSETLARLQKRGDIIVGKDSDFQTWKDLYCLILPSNATAVLLFCDGKLFYSVPEYVLTDFENYKSHRRLWIK
jgi:hypothetical protein